MMLLFSIEDGRTGYIFSPREGKQYFIPMPDLCKLLCDHVKKQQGRHRHHHH